MAGDEVSPVNAPAPEVALVPIGAGNWRAAVALRVHPHQTEFVAPVSWYLTLCAYGGEWHPFGIMAGAEMVGFVMTAIDDSDDSLWIGGLLIDAAHQRRGYGRRAVELLIERAAGHSGVALSYLPHNPARDLYAALGFTETGEMEDEELVARR